jgi:hypothetical protein
MSKKKKAAKKKASLNTVVVDKAPDPSEETAVLEVVDLSEAEIVSPDMVEVKVEVSEDLPPVAVVPAVKKEYVKIPTCDEMEEAYYAEVHAKEDAQRKQDFIDQNPGLVAKQERDARKAAQKQAKNDKANLQAVEVARQKLAHAEARIAAQVAKPKQD